MITTRTLPEYLPGAPPNPEQADLYSRPWPGQGDAGGNRGPGKPRVPFPAWPPWAPWVPLSWQWCAAKVCSLINNWPVRHSSWLILALFGSSWLLRKFHQRAIHMFESTRDIEPRFAWLLAEPRFAWLTSEESQGLPGSQSL